MVGLGRIATFILVSLLISPSVARAQREDIARAVAEARLLGTEAALVHVAEHIGPTGVGECLERAQRSGRLICAQAARYLEQPWAALPTLATVLDDHDRQVASRAADSMSFVVERLSTGDLGQQEPLPEEVEATLTRLRELASNRSLSPEIRAQIVTVASAVARLVGGGLDVARAAIEDDEVAVRRAAVGALSGSGEAADVAALTNAARADSDLLVVALATAAVCEATLRVGRPVPDGVGVRMRQFLEDERARPAIALPVLACLVRCPEEATAALRALAARHPNAATRAAWEAMRTGGEAQP